jgi:hypothetical protein
MPSIKESVDFKARDKARKEVKDKAKKELKKQAAKAKKEGVK